MGHKKDCRLVVFVLSMLVVVLIALYCIRNTSLVHQSVM